MTKGLIVAGPWSGCGKTTATLGLLAALRRRGLRVAPFKVGPDFIDPGHHGRVAGVSSRNLDGWMLPRETNREIFHKSAAGADVAVVEGVMGLFDGYDGRTEAGSTAQMAKWLGLPVLLVVNAASMARSAAALVLGFEKFDPELTFAGILFNGLGSPRHFDYLREAMKGHAGAPCLGGLPRNPEVAIPERHLGLFTDADHPLDPAAADRLADLAETGLNIDELLERLPEISTGSPSTAATVPEPDVRLGVASDAAFCFYYPDNFDLLRAAGVEIVPFSPVNDAALPPNLDGLYFGGGYPELFAKALAENGALRREIRETSRSGMPIYGECGGFMYLCDSLADAEDRRFPMTGCFPFRTAMPSRLRALGYREITLRRTTLLGEAGTRIRGHEFHYSSLAETPEGTETAYAVAGRHGAAASDEGFVVDRTLGSYIHLHFGSRPEAARHFTSAMRAYANERKSAS
ncbi:MAG: cobyrinate a,c-diamide synthase [Desulfococcaceae bacterium]